jgi:hypothetical protein
MECLNRSQNYIVRSFAVCFLMSPSSTFNSRCFSTVRECFFSVGFNSTGSLLVRGTILNIIRFVFKLPCCMLLEFLLNRSQDYPIARRRSFLWICDTEAARFWSNTWIGDMTISVSEVVSFLLVRNLENRWKKKIDSFVFKDLEFKWGART